MARAKAAVRPVRESLGQEHKYQVTKYCDQHREIFVNRTDAQVAEHLSKHFGFQVKASHVNGIRAVLGIAKRNGAAPVGFVTQADFAIVVSLVGELIQKANGVAESDVEVHLRKYYPAFAELEDRVLADF